MDRRDWIKILGFGVLFGASTSTLQAKLNLARRLKFPGCSLDWMSNTVDFIKSSFRGQVVLLVGDCYIDGPKIDCKEFPSDTEVKLTSAEWQAPKDMTIKTMLVVDRHGNVICEKEIDKTVKACDQLTFTYSIHLPPLKFSKPCSCDKTSAPELGQPAEVKLTPTPLEE